MLELVEVHKRFGRRGAGGVQALRGVSLAVGSGEVVGLVGPNGAGKTTLLRIAVGFLDADAGRASIGGHDLIAARGAAQALLGYLPEVAPGPAELVVERYLALRAAIKGVAERGAAVERVIAQTELGPMRRRPIGTLSKGYRQRVGLAEALLADPPLLVLDEPASGLDPLAVRGLRELVRSAAKRRAVLLSSHSLGELEALADRVAVLYGGQLVADAAPDELKRQTGQGELEAAVLALFDEARQARGAGA